MSQSKHKELCDLVKSSVATSQGYKQSFDKVVEINSDLTKLNARLLELVKDAPDFAIIIKQANEDSIRATEAREQVEFLEGLLRTVCCK